MATPAAEQPAIQLFGFIPPTDPTVPFVEPLPAPGIPVEPTLPSEAVALVLFALAIGTQFAEPPRPRQKVKPPDKEPNKRVLKLQSAYDAVDKIVTSSEIGWAIAKMIPAFIHLQMKHTPTWVNWDEMTLEVSQEITVRLRDKLKAAMKEKILQQDNTRKNVTMKARDRVGKLHSKLL